MKRCKKKSCEKKNETMVNRIQKGLKGTEKIFFEFFFDNCLRSKKVVLSFFFVFFFFGLIKKSFKNLEMMT